MKLGIKGRHNRGKLRLGVLLLALLLAVSVMAVAREAKASGRSFGDVLRDAIGGSSSVFGNLLRKLLVGFGLAIGALLAIPALLGASPAIAALAAIGILVGTGAYAISAGLVGLPQLGGGDSSSGSGSGSGVQLCYDYVNKKQVPCDQINGGYKATIAALDRYPETEEL